MTRKAYPVSRTSARQWRLDALVDLIRVRATAGGASIAAILAVAIPHAALSQDADHGRQVFRVCLPCHVPDAYTNKLGPHLKGVFGRTAGSANGFRYSQAMRDAGAAGLAWDEENLSAFLSSPKSKVPGTSMRFWGFWSQSKIDDVIAYLKANP